MSGPSFYCYNEKAMSFSFIYILQRALYRLGDFFHNWYVHGSRNLTHYFISVFERVDQVLAVRVTLRYFFYPLYKDYSVTGRILGIIFRSGRILIGVSVYAFLAVIFLIVYLLWFSAPPALILYATKELQ